MLHYNHKCLEMSLPKYGILKRKLHGQSIQLNLLNITIQFCSLLILFKKFCVSNKNYLSKVSIKNWPYQNFWMVWIWPTLTEPLCDLELNHALFSKSVKWFHNLTHSSKLVEFKVILIEIIFMVFINNGEILWRYNFMAIDKSVFDLRRKVPFVQQEKMHARNLVVHGALQCAF